MSDRPDAPRRSAEAAGLRYVSDDGDLPVRAYRRTSSDGPELSPPEAALLEVLERVTRR